MCVGITVIVESTDSLSVDVGADAFMWLLVDLSRCENLNSRIRFITYLLLPVHPPAACFTVAILYGLFMHSADAFIRSEFTVQ